MGTAPRSTSRAESPAEAHERLLAYVEETGRTFVHPFDDPVLQAGHGTLGLEVVEDLPDVATIVVPVGGGGLIAGVASRCRLPCRRSRARAARRRCPPRSRPASPFASSRARSRTASTRRSPARARSPSCRERVDEIVLVSEDEIADGMRFLYTRAKLACEPAGAAAVAALLADKVEVEPGSPVVAVVSGGNADPKVAAGILASR